MPRPLSRRLGRIAFTPFCRTKRFMSHAEAFMGRAEAFMSHVKAFMSHAEAFMSHAEGEPRWTARRAVLPVALDETHYRRLAASPLRRQDDGPVRQDVDPFTLWFVQILDVEAVFRTDDAHRGPCVAINAAVGTEVQRRAVG